MRRSSPVAIEQIATGNSCGERRNGIGAVLLDLRVFLYSSASKFRATAIRGHFNPLYRMHVARRRPAVELRPRRNRRLQNSAKCVARLCNPAFCRVPDLLSIDDFGKRAIEIGRDLFIASDRRSLVFRCSPSNREAHADGQQFPRRQVHQRRFANVFDRALELVARST
ncbi:hypothetical protein NXT3_PB00126 (plasmid) [Sinorhizobium fredii]|uniref:Uncharacterized protein n=1 Tax=Rhizobium fredii TaxID=380 RepID=A0A2L0HBB4_RHIFR|nr:hypothetical protein NXT3_PB00126 [Sinorhizobium fredii]